MLPEPIRFSVNEGDINASASSAPPVAITQMLEDHASRLEEQFRELDAELRRRFGEHSYSVDRSEQVLGAIQRLRWAIARSPVVNPLPTPAEAEPGSRDS